MNNIIYVHVQIYFLVFLIFVSSKIFVSNLITAHSALSIEAVPQGKFGIDHLNWSRANLSLHYPRPWNRLRAFDACKTGRVHPLLTFAFVIVHRRVRASNQRCHTPLSFLPPSLRAASAWCRASNGKMRLAEKLSTVDVGYS